MTACLPLEDFTMNSMQLDCFSSFESEKNVSDEFSCEEKIFLDGLFAGEDDVPTCDAPTCGDCVNYLFTIEQLEAKYRRDIEDIQRQAAALKDIFEKKIFDATVLVKANLDKRHLAEAALNNRTKSFYDQIEKLETENEKKLKIKTDRISFLEKQLKMKNTERIAQLEKQLEEKDLQLKRTHDEIDYYMRETKKLKRKCACDTQDSEEDCFDSEEENKNAAN